VAGDQQRRDDTADAYRDAQYRTSDPSRHFRVGSKYPVASSVSEIKEQQKIDKLDAMTRTLPDEEVQQLSGDLENQSNVMNARKIDCLRTANIKATQIIPISQQALDKLPYRFHHIIWDPLLKPTSTLLMLLRALAILNELC
jgi:hypothetical protein